MKGFIKIKLFKLTQNYNIFKSFNTTQHIEIYYIKTYFRKYMFINSKNKGEKR